uniref:Uncharacterized protein n=1 Tax=Oryza brachyantha TaxID=4533 RepID=J3N516_ORYBR
GASRRIRPPWARPTGATCPPAAPRRSGATPPGSSPTWVGSDDAISRAFFNFSFLFFFDKFYLYFLFYKI